MRSPVWILLCTLINEQRLLIPSEDARNVHRNLRSSKKGTAAVYKIHWPFQSSGCILSVASWKQIILLRHILNCPDQMKEKNLHLITHGRNCVFVVQSFVSLNPSTRMPLLNIYIEGSKFQINLMITLPLQSQLSLGIRLKLKSISVIVNI